MKCAWRSPPWAIHGRRGVDSIDCIGKVCQGHQFGIWRTFDKARTEKPRALLTNVLVLHVFKCACINCLDEHGRRTHALMTNGTRCALFKKVLVASKRGHFFFGFCAHCLSMCVAPSSICPFFLALLHTKLLLLFFVLFGLWERRAHPWFKLRWWVPSWWKPNRWWC